MTEPFARLRAEIEKMSSIALKMPGGPILMVPVENVLGAIDRAETQRSSSGARSDKTEIEGGGSRTEPALTDEQIDKITYAVGLWERPPIWDDMDKMRRFARALLIATKSHPSGDQGL